jgi:hypothetical protein
MVGNLQIQQRYSRDMHRFGVCLHSCRRQAVSQPNETKVLKDSTNGCHRQQHGHEQWPASHTDTLFRDGQLALARHGLGGGADGLPDGPRNAKYVPRYGLPAVAKER